MNVTKMRVRGVLVVVSSAILATMSLSACQPGRIAEKVTDFSSASSGNTTPGTPINMGTVGSGVQMNVDLNPTPTPVPTVNPNTGTVINTNPSSMIDLPKTNFLYSLLSFVISDASALTNVTNVSTGTYTNTNTLTNTLTVTNTNTFTVNTSPVTGTLTFTQGPVDPIPADKYEIFYGTQLTTQLINVVGTSQFSTYQTQYANYLSDAATNPNATIPASLLTPVSVSFLSFKGQLSTLTVKVIDLLDPNASVIVFATTAWIGKSVVPPVGTAVATPFANLSGLKLIRYGSGLKGFGGLSPGGFNRGIFDLTFTAGTATSPAFFTVSASSGTTLTPPAAGVTSIQSLPVTAALKTAAGTPGSAWAPTTTVLIAYGNASSQLVGFFSYQLNTPLTAPIASAVTCASVVSYFPGYTCPTGTGTATFTNTVTTGFTTGTGVSTSVFTNVGTGTSTTTGTTVR